jgi:hypothetical protein
MLLQSSRVSPDYGPGAAAPWRLHAACPADLAAVASARARVFHRRYPGVPYPDQPTAADLNGTSFVLRFAGAIVGAVRMNLARVGTADRLPTESDTWRVDEAAPFLFDPSDLRTEIGGLFTDPDFVPAQHAQALYVASVEAACNVGARQLIIVAPSANLRLYRLVGRTIGHELILRTDVDTAELSRRYGISVAFAHAWLDRRAVP